MSVPSSNTRSFWKASGSDRFRPLGKVGWDARRTACSARIGTTVTPAGDPRSPDASALSWLAAKDHLARAIQRHGRDHRAAALAELAAIHPTLERFVLTARWTALCEHPLHFSERQYRDLWSELTERNSDHQERTAA